MNRSWFMFYGFRLGMSRQETLDTLYGEFMDFLACDSIITGHAKQKKTKRKISIDDLMLIE